MDDEQKSRPNCYRCIHRGEVIGSVHSRCLHPEAKKLTVDNPLAEVLAIFRSVGRGPGLTLRAMNVEGDPHGIRMGWFEWPLNFDPVWLRRCDGFAARKAGSDPQG